jgi:hypothetical protein
MKTLPMNLFHLGALACAIGLGLTGCVASPAGSAPAALPAASAASSSSASPAAVRVTGLLTLKGPELGAWWALTEASGVVWRLDMASADQFKQLRLWQNQQVEVEGVLNGTYLSTSRVRVAIARLKSE